MLFRSIVNRAPAGGENRIYVRDGRMYVWYNGDLYVLDRKNIRGTELLVGDDKRACFAEYPDPRADHGMNVYYFEAASTGL